MTEATRHEVGTLEAMGVSALRRKYAEIYGEATRSGNRRWLVRRIAWRLQALAEGDLPERARARAAGLARDADLRVRPPSGWERGGPDLGAGLRTVTGKIEKRPDDRLPAPGTVLVREFKGVEHRVTVLRDGFEFDGETFRSLSGVAHAITGGHWSGYAFFGLTTRRPTPERTGGRVDRNTE